MKIETIQSSILTIELGPKTPEFSTKRISANKNSEFDVYFL